MNLLCIIIMMKMENIHSSKDVGNLILYIFFIVLNFYYFLFLYSFLMKSKRMTLKCDIVEESKRSKRK